MEKFIVTIELQTIEIVVSARNKAKAKKKALERLSKKNPKQLIDSDWLTNRKRFGLTNTKTNIMNTYFLFGTDACQKLLHEGEDALVAFVYGGGICRTFKFAYCKTSPVELLEAREGWDEHTVISQELYIKLLNI